MALPDLVEAVLEEMTVGVQGHRRGGVSEHLLHHLDLGAGGDGEAGGGVAELVGMQSGDADGSGGVIERLAEGAHAQGRATADPGEYEIVGSLAGDVSA